MSLHPQPIEPVPDETSRITCAAFPGGNPYLALRDELRTVFTDADFAAFYPRRGRPAEAPWRLALVTVLQFAEGLSDRLADTARGRIHWKYALGLALDDPGFNASVLCEFRRCLLDGSAEQRLGETPYLILDARYEHVRHGGQVVPCAVLVAIGIDPKGKRAILGVSVSLSEAEVHWREFLATLQGRGLHGVRLVVSDAHAGLKEALKARMTGAPRQRCQFHLLENALAFGPRPGMQEPVVASLRAVFDAPDRPEPERQLDNAVKKYRASVPSLAGWLEANVPEGLAAFALPAWYRRLRTIKMLERLNRELKRPTRNELDLPDIGASENPPPQDATNGGFRDGPGKARARVPRAYGTRAVRQAEREGFEPSVRFDPYTAFPVPHLRPLGHLSRRSGRRWVHSDAGLCSGQPRRGEE
jgi:transposase